MNKNVSVATPAVVCVQNQPQSAPVNNVALVQGAVIVCFLAIKNNPRLIHRNALLEVDAQLDSANGFVTLDIETDPWASERLRNDSHESKRKRGRWRWVIEIHMHHMVGSESRPVQAREGDAWNVTGDERR